MQKFFPRDKKVFLSSWKKYIPSLEMYVPSLGMYVSSLGIYVPSLGMNFFIAREKLFCAVVVKSSPCSSNFFYEKFTDTKP